MRVPQPIFDLAAGLALTALATASVTAAAAAKQPGSANSGGVSLMGPQLPLSTPTYPSVPRALLSTPAHPMVPGLRAKIIHGVAYAPAEAPIQVQRAIWAGNRIRHKAYIYGGGHGSFTALGYDCSGSVSFVLHAAGLLSTPLDSSDFMSWGDGGLGAWITVYTNPSHAFVEIAGIRFDTSAEGDRHPAPGSGPHWRPLLMDTSAYSARHPANM